MSFFVTAIQLFMVGFGRCKQIPLAGRLNSFSLLHFSSHIVHHGNDHALSLLELLDPFLTSSRIDQMEMERFIFRLHYRHATDIRKVSCAPYCLNVASDEFPLPFVSVKLRDVAG